MHRKIYYARNGFILGPFLTALTPAQIRELDIHWSWDSSQSKWVSMDPVPKFEPPASDIKDQSANVALLDLGESLVFGVLMIHQHPNGGVLRLDLLSEQTRLRFRPERLGRLQFPVADESWMIQLVFEDEPGSWIFVRINQ